MFSITDGTMWWARVARHAHRSLPCKERAFFDGSAVWPVWYAVPPTKGGILYIAGVRFTEVQARPSEFLDLTSLTLVEFQQ